MRIGNRPKSTDRQGFLFPMPLGNHGHVRTIIGDLTEVLTARFLGGVRLRTSGDCDYCPDIRCGEWSPDGWTPGTYWCECKAAGRSNQTLIYAGRLDKDREFARSHPFFYVIWTHSLDTKTCQTVQELEYRFMLSLTAVHVVPFEVIDILCSRLPVTPLNSAYGNSNGNPLYGAGYRLSIKSLQTDATLTFSFRKQTYVHPNE